MGLGNGGGAIYGTKEGGLAIYMINKTGAASVKGYLVKPSDTTDNGAMLIEQNIPDVIGVIYENGIADGALMRVVVSGKAEVYFIASVVRDNLARGFVTADGGIFVAGQGMSEAIPSSPFANDKHFYEFGHTLQARTGAGLALTNLHFN
jgi:hypothetical protein